MSTARRPRKPQRRFSSVSNRGAWSNAFEPLTTSININASPIGAARLRGRRQQSSKSSEVPKDASQGASSATSASDIEEEVFIFSTGDTEDSSRRVYSAPIPMTYASLPPTPMEQSPLPSPVIESSFLRSPMSPVSSMFSVIQRAAPPFSLWDYLQEELLATDFDSHQELKWERVSNFLKIPLAIEKIIGFGFILCLDSFLYTFTILPIRASLAFCRLFLNLFRSSGPLPPSQKADILRILLLLATILICIPLTDASKIYHFIRGQETIKLYVIFNALEIGDRLCASIGQDILDCLFSRSTLEPLSRRLPVSTRTFRPLVYFTLATIYNVVHTIVMVYQLISLNVAVNSYDHALLTLLVSNQFVEIKGSVFKKFEKDNLFQIMCADIVERFTLGTMLCVVAFRNLIELSGSEFDFTDFTLPKSFGWFRGNNVLWTISYPVLTVMISEMLVDWLKHAFITKFNHIQPSVYERYTDVLCRDLSSASAYGRRGAARKHTYVDQSPLVARRLGFASLPLAALAVLIGSQSINLLFSSSTSSELSTAQILHLMKWVVMGVLFWVCVVVVKIMLGINLISYATMRRTGMERRTAEDAINDFGRNPIGEGKEEQIYNRELKNLLGNKRDDVMPVAEIGESNPDAVKGKRGRVKLEDLTRFTMVKRIW